MYFFESSALWAVEKLTLSQSKVTYSFDLRGLGSYEHCGRWFKLMPKNLHIDKIWTPQVKSPSSIS